MAKGLLLLAGGKPKGSPFAKEKPEPESDEGGAAEDTLAGEAFDAFQEGDREGFVAAFRAAVKACAGKASAGGYEEEDEDVEGF